MKSIRQKIYQISSVMQTNSATAEESAAASEELSGQARLLKGMVERFTLKEGENGRQKVIPVQETPYSGQTEWTSSSKY